MQMKRKLMSCALGSILGMALLAHGSTATAMNLQEAYDAALKNDQAYRAAYYANEGGKENRALGLSNLLPSLSANYSRGKNRSDILTGSSLTHPAYDSKSASLQLRQALFSLDALARYKEGGLQADYSASVYLSEQQQVVVRVVGAYVDTLFRLDQLAQAQAERDTYVERMKVNDRMFAKGEGTRTDMLETRARLDVAEAAVLEAQDNLQASRVALGAIVGGDVGELAMLVPDFRRLPSDAYTFEDWKRATLDHNPDLKAKLIGVDISQQEVNKARAGHTPRLDFIASYSKSNSDSINTINQDYTTRSIGIQLNIPLYAGGSVNASTRQAVANREKAKADAQAEADKQVLELRKDYDSLVSSVAKIDALMKAVDSGKLLVTATEQSIKGGVRINLDLLDAQRQLSVTQRDLSQARYTYVLSYIKLRAAAGALSADDVRAIAPFFR